MLEQALGGIGGHLVAMAWSAAHVEAKAPRRIRRAVAARAPRANWSATSAANRSGASASSRARSSAAGPRSSASATRGSPARIDQFPPGKKAGGALTLLVDGAHAPLIQHLTPMIVERVNRFFGYAAINRIVFRQGKPPRRAEAERPQLRPVPKELGEGLREIADPELRACLESLAAQIAASSGAAVASERPRRPDSRDQPERIEPMKVPHFPGRARGRPRACRLQQEQEQGGDDRHRQ